MRYDFLQARSASPCLSVCRAEGGFRVPEGDLTWLIGGAQGGGVDTSGGVFARFGVRSGARVFANIEYHSNIMGEHSYYRVRLSKQDRHSILDRVNVLVALDLESLTGDPHLEFQYSGSFHGHVPEVLPGGVVIYDTASKFDPARAERSDIRFIGVPYLELLRDALKTFGREGDANRLRVMMNTVAVGASVFAIGGDIETLAQLYHDDFTGRRAELADLNARAATVGYEFAEKEMGGDTPFSLKTIASPPVGRR